MTDKYDALLFPAVVIPVLALAMCLRFWCKSERRAAKPKNCSSDCPHAPVFDKNGVALTIYRTLGEAREYVATGRVARHEAATAAPLSALV